MNDERPRKPDEAEKSREGRPERQVESGTSDSTAAPASEADDSDDSAGSAAGPEAVSAGDEGAAEDQESADSGSGVSVPPDPAAAVKSAAVLDEFFASGGEDVLLDETASPPGFRAGYVAFVGRPNVGKSTLMNCFLEQRIAIVTSKPQTTRRKTLGILNSDRYQIVMLDTPGIMEPKYALHDAMIHEAKSALDDADVIVYLADASKPPVVLPVLERINKPRLVAVNKVDRVTKKDLLIPVLDGFHKTGLFDEILPISALHGDGVDALLQAILERIPEAPPLYPQEQISEQPERFFVAEIVREQVFRLYDQEVPYSTEALVTSFEERARGKDFIEATIFVESDSQKAILIGKGGLAVKQLGEDARVAVESFLGREVFLSLRVKTMSKWRKKAASLRKLGYKG